MKKLYSFLVAAAFTTAAFAQGQTAVTACKKASGEISIIFDISKNCSFVGAGSKDSLGKRTAIGFHSGANAWSVGRDFNSTTPTAAITAIRLAGTSGATAKFNVLMPDPKAYYGLAATPTDIKFVFNDGAATPGTPWAFEGKGTNAAGTGCEDFLITVASLPACAVGTQELQNVNAAVAPNPFKTATYITFNNANSKVHTLTLMDAVGRVVRTYSNITSDVVEIKRDNLPAGMYFAILKNADGQSITQKLMAE
jgi:hypothetical protein